MCFNILANTTFCKMIQSPAFVAFLSTCFSLSRWATLSTLSRILQLSCAYFFDLSYLRKVGFMECIVSSIVSWTALMSASIALHVAIASSNVSSRSNSRLLTRSFYAEQQRFNDHSLVLVTSS